MKYLTIVIALFISFNSFEQVTYQKVFGDAETSFNLFMDACVTGDHEVVNAGFWTPSLASTPVQPFITKLDENGTVMWSKEYKSPGQGFAQSIAPTADGGYLVAGRIDTLNSGGSDDAFVLKVDSNGNQLWMRIIGSSADETLKRVYEAPNGDVVAVGINNSTMNSDQYAWFVQLSSTGTLINSFVYFGSGNSEAYSLLFHPDGGYVIGGIGIVNNEDEAFLFKISELGSLEWFKSYGSFGEAERIHDMVLLNDTSIVFVGTRGFSNNDIFIGKSDSVGNLMWLKNYGGPEHDEAYRILQHSDNGFLVGGSTEGLDGALGQLIFKIDADGNVEWSRVMGEYYSNGTVGLNQLSNGAIIHSGTLLPTQGSAVATVFQLNENGEGCDFSSVSLPAITESTHEDTPTPSVSYGPSNAVAYNPTVANVVLSDSTVCSDLSVEEYSDEAAISVYPNPVRQGHEIWVTNATAIIEPIRLIVYDQMGRSICKVEETNETFSISTKGWSQGVYTLILETSEDLITRRVVLN